MAGVDQSPVSDLLCGGALGPAAPALPACLPACLAILFALLLLPSAVR